MDRASQSLARPGAVLPLGGRADPERRRHAIAAAAVTAAALSAVLLGALAAYSPTAALAALISIGYVALVLRNLPIALALWIPLIFFEGLSGFSKIPEAAGLLLALGWVGALAWSRPSGQLGGRVPPMVLLPLAALTLWLTASLLWAQVPEESFVTLARFYAVVVLFVMLVNRVTSRRVLIWVLAAFVVGACLSVVYGIVTGLSEASTAMGNDAAVTSEGRLQGGVGDPNFLAASLISGAALIGAIGIAKQASFRLRALLVLVGALLPIGVLSTGSRGGVLAAAAAVLLTLVVLRGYRRRVLALVVFGLVAIAVYATFSPVAPLQRFTALEGGGSGRADLWTVGWRMSVDHPGLGVGVANFTPRAHEYAREPGALTRVNYISEVGMEVHNLYLQLTTETGLPGLLLLLAFVCACLRCTWRAAQRFRAAGQHQMDTFARLVLIAQVSMLAADVFLSGLVDKRLWIILALGPVLANVAARETVPVTPTAAR